MRRLKCSRPVTPSRSRSMRPRTGCRLTCLPERTVRALPQACRKGASDLAGVWSQPGCGCPNLRRAMPGDQELARHMHPACTLGSGRGRWQTREPECARMIRARRLYIVWRLPLRCALCDTLLRRDRMFGVKAQTSLVAVPLADRHGNVTQLIVFRVGDNATMLNVESMPVIPALHCYIALGRRP